MNCPICSSATMVLSKHGVERRRRCTVCKHTFATVEKLRDEDRRQAEAVQTVLDAADRLKAAA